MPRCIFFVCGGCWGHLSCLVFSELAESIVWFLTLIWGTFSIIVANISSVAFFLLLVSPLCICYAFRSCPQLLDILFCFCFVLILLFPFQFLEVSIDTSSSSETLSSAMSYLLYNKSIKSILHSCYSLGLFWF